MTSTAYANKGQRLAYTVQSAFETVNTTSPKDIRADGEITVASSQSQGVVPETVFVDALQREKPVLFRKYEDSAVKITALIRQATAAGGTPFLVDAFRSAGLTVATPSNDTTIAAYTNTTSYTLTDAAATDAGEFRTIVLNDGRHVPILMAADASGAGITPLHALPSAAQAGNVVRKCWTITPGQPGPVPADKFLSLFFADRANAASRNIRMTGCWLSEIGELVIEPGTLPKIELTFGAAEVAESASDILMTTANDFADSAPVQVTDDPLVFFATYSSAGSVAAAYQKIIKGSIKLGVKTVPIEGVGDSGCLNGAQGAMLTLEPCEVSLDILWDGDKLTDWEGTNTSKMIAIVQPTAAATVPAWAFVVPNAHIMERPEIDRGSMIVQKLKYTANPPAMGSTTTINAAQNQAWYFGISDRSA